MASLKQEALRVIAGLPENAVIDDIMYELYVLDKIMKGQSDIQNGSYSTVEELKKEIKTW